MYAGHLYAFFGKMPIQIVCLFFNWIVSFCCYIGVRVLYIFWILATYKTNYLQIFSTIRKGRGTRDQIANIRRIIKKARELQKNIYFCFIDYAKAFDSVDHNKLWKILKEMGIPDHLTCLLRNLYAGQETTVRT